MMKILAIASCFALLASLAVAQSGAPWSYEGKTGPIIWSKLDPAYAACNKGHAQSPIDIRGAHLDKALRPIEFHYISGGVTFENNGHTLLATVHPGSYIVADGVRYDLVQFHFHHPGEEVIKGKFADMDVHLVHKSADGKLAVVAVRFQQDQDIPNALLSTLWQHLPTAPGKSEIITEPINPGGFLPQDRGYWTYTGSLTAPPCTEGVRWFIFQQDMTMSRSQFKLANALLHVNARPLQDAHGRHIEASE
ncbi:carbonic anhydrase [Telmatobacter bradus]|uniref:carbonic anhydrase n=1 Tax=Telmatobacter bradus TaxID=474953 RepID=UPI003B437514